MLRTDFTLDQSIEKYSELILEWRNSDRVRMNMFEHHIIPFENHLKWIDSLEGNPYSRCLVVKLKSEPMGVITVKRTNMENDSWIWGCYLGPNKLVAKAGTIMGFLALEYYFEQMKVKQITGEAVAANVRSLEFNARLGFRTVHFFSRTNSKGESIPAVYLEMNQEEWPAHKERLFTYCFSSKS